MYIRPVFILCLLLQPTLHFCQPFFQNTYDNSGAEDYLVAAVAGPSDIITAGTSSGPNGQDWVWIQKLNTNGIVVWSRLFDPGGPVATTGLLTAGDGYIVVYNLLDSNMLPKSAGWLKIDNDGQLRWNQHATSPCALHAALALKNGYLLTGSTLDDTNTPEDALALKINEQGDISWAQVFGQSGPDALMAATTDADDNIFGAGYTTTPAGDQNALLVKIGNSGTLLGLQQQYGGSADDMFTAIARTNNNRLLLGGTSRSFNTVYNALWLSAVDLDGAVRWSKTLAIPEQSIGATQLARLDNGRFLLTVNNPNPGLDNPAVVFNFNEDGEYSWANRYRTTGELDLIRQTIPVPQGFITVGTLRRDGGTDGWLQYLNAEGLGPAGCCPVGDFRPTIKEVTTDIQSFLPHDGDALKALEVPALTTPAGIKVKDLCIDVSFSVSDSSICIGDCIAVNIGGNTPSVIYTFENNGAQGDPAQAGNLCYLSSGDFFIVRRGNNGFCKVASAPLLVSVSKTDDQFPNAFTPNGDDLNEVFRPLFYCPVQSTLLRIYNRWGARVFETQNPQEGWDGRINGENAPSDVYVWYLEYEAVRAEGRMRFFKKGNLTLLR